MTEQAQRPLDTLLGRGGNDTNSQPAVESPKHDSQPPVLYCVCRRPDDGRFMICCEVCQEWFHGQCVGVDERCAQEILEFHCKNCEQTAAGPSILRTARKSSRVKTNIDYTEENGGQERRRIIDILKNREFHAENFDRMSGEDFDLDYLKNRGFTEPLIFERTDGLGMKMPPSNITVSEVAKIIGDRPIEVMNGVNQESMKGWTLFQWANYFETKQEDKKMILNVISLEVSGTKLAEYIERPLIIKQIDWVDKCWPEKETKENGVFPKVQTYCLMSPRGCWTDFHIDFGGTSVYYHILSGKKIFFMVPPTKTNLQKYERWCLSDQQSATFFPDTGAGPCYMVELHAGQTMMIPSGWIHGVFTPKDAIVIGGNFIHGFSIPMQLFVYEIEKRTKVPASYRFPHFEKLLWYSANHYLYALQDDPLCVSDFELEGLESLADFLFKQLVKALGHKGVQNFEDVKFTEQKAIRENIPTDLWANGEIKNTVVTLSQVIGNTKINRGKRLLIGSPTAWGILTPPKMDERYSKTGEKNSTKRKRASLDEI